MHTTTRSTKTTTRTTTKQQPLTGPATAGDERRINRKRKQVTTTAAAPPTEEQQPTKASRTNKKTKSSIIPSSTHAPQSQLQVVSQPSSSTRGVNESSIRFNPYRHLREAYLGPQPLCLVLNGAGEPKKDLDTIPRDEDEEPLQPYLAPIFVHFIDQEFKSVPQRVRHGSCVLSYESDIHSVFSLFLRRVSEIPASNDFFAEPPSEAPKSELKTTAVWQLQHIIHAVLHNCQFEHPVTYQNKRRQLTVYPMRLQLPVDDHHWTQYYVDLAASVNAQLLELSVGPHPIGSYYRFAVQIERYDSKGNIIRDSTPAVDSLRAKSLPPPASTVPSSSANSRFMSDALATSHPIGGPTPMEIDLPPTATSSKRTKLKHPTVKMEPASPTVRTKSRK